MPQQKSQRHIPLKPDHSSMVAIVQARMGSTRLPGKILMDLAGRPMLARVLERTARATSIDRIVVATSDLEADDAVARFCKESGYECFRGSESDVLDRYYQAARSVNADFIVRITSDCPLIDPRIIDQAVEKFRSVPGCDYLSNTLTKPTFPAGLDVEVMSFAALERAWKEDANPALREHVTAYMYKNPQAFRLAEIENESDFSTFRWTVDTTEDLDLVRNIYSHFGESEFHWRDVVDLLGKHPEWNEINRGVRQKQV